MIADADLLALAKRGLIPGPAEPEDEFLKRAAKSKPLGQEAWDEASDITAALYGIQVDWVPCTYSNKKLPFWEGAATWVSEEGTSIQLRTNFKKGRYFGYAQKEVLSHEAVHAARCKFVEPRFEEILAYRTSSNGFRRWFGPLFRRPWESITFLLFFPFGLYLLFRLLRDQSLFARCLKSFSLPAILCMTDAEIARGQVEGQGIRQRLIRALFSKVRD